MIRGTIRGRETLRRAAAWPRRWPIVAAVGALVGATAVWWHTGEPPDTAGAQTLVSATAAAPASPAATVRPITARVAPLPPPPITPYPASGVPGIASDDPLTAYKKANVYPPTSRPLTRDQLDLLRPNQRHESLRE